MPRVTGYQWTVPDACASWHTAARAAAAHFGAAHFGLECCGTDFVAFGIALEADDDAAAPFGACWCPTCYPLAHAVGTPTPTVAVIDCATGERRVLWPETTPPEAAPARQATPTPTPDPLAQVDADDADDEDDGRDECAACGEEWDADDLHAVGRRGRLLCPDCRTVCDRCDDTVQIDHTGSVYTGPRGSRGMQEAWCDDCTSDHSWRCARCDESMADTVRARYADHDDDEEQPICPACWRSDDDAPPVVFTIDPYHCAQRRDDCRPVVSEWTRTHGGRCVGVELEVEYTPRTHDAPHLRTIASAMIEAARDHVPAWRDGGRRLLWAETDGSLARGFELISAPAGLDTQRALWHAVLACPEVAHLRSHDTTTCGLHVHLTRPGQWLTAKLAQWVALPSTEELVRLVARRYGSSYAHMEHRPLSRATVRHYDRYTAVNTTNRATVELRIFRGSLRAQTVLAAVEFAHAAAAYVEDTSARHLDAPDTAARFLRRIHAPDLHKDTTHLRAYISDRTARFPTRAPRIAQALAEMPRKTKTTPAAPACATTTESED